MSAHLFSPGTQRVIDAIAAVSVTSRVPVVAQPDLDDVNSLPTVPHWVSERPYLTGSFLEASSGPQSRLNNGAQAKLSSYPLHIQEILVLEDVLFALLGFHGRFIHSTASNLHGVEGGEAVLLAMDGSGDASLVDLVNRILPLCNQYAHVRLFVGRMMSRGYEKGMILQAFSAATQELLADYTLLCTQLEQQFRDQKLTLQRLWFFVQPAIQTMKVLSAVVSEIDDTEAVGGVLLNLLHKWSLKVAGDPAAKALLFFLMQKTAIPFFRMLEAWIYQGEIEDPYGEFLVAENKTLTKQSLLEDYSDEYWTERYAIREASFPHFLDAVASKILTTGKYLNVIRECGKQVKCPHASILEYTSDEQQYVSKIEQAFHWASKQLLGLIMVQESLLPRLQSVKHYFMLDEGDWFVHFMDSASDDLSRSVADLSRTKLESLLELSIRTSIANVDPYKEDVVCVLLKEPLAHQLTKIFLAARPGVQAAKIAPTNPMNLTGLEAFALDYRVRWPLSLVINRRAMTKYQLLFRHLFNCKHVERLLSNTWAQQQGLKEFRVHHLLARVYNLRQRMLHFLHNYEYYMMVEVLEPTWHDMAVKVTKEAETVDDVMKFHNDFLDTCLKACLLTNIHLINRLSKILKVCLTFSKNMDSFFKDLLAETAASTQQLYDKPRGDKKVNIFSRERSNRIDMSSAFIRASLDDDQFAAAIAKMENDFHLYLKDLLDALGSHSHSTSSESHLSHLTTRLDYNGYYKQTLKTGQSVVSSADKQ
eukprot:ANDGO_03807.mRNA.1 Spindle pole body component 97